MYMIKNYFKILILATMFIESIGLSFASSLYLKPSDNFDIKSGFVSYDVMLDTGVKDINALSGSLFFDSNLLELDSVDTTNGIFSNWLKDPGLSNEINLNLNKRIDFEGVVFGGFIGTISPYKDYAYPGKVFTVKFLIKNEGLANFYFDNLDLRLNDGEATKINLNYKNLSIYLPKIDNLQRINYSSRDNLDIGSESLSIFIDRDNLIDDGKWFVYFNEDSIRKSVSHYEIAESNKYNPYDVSSYEWYMAKSPHVLKYQKLNKFIHIKVVYEDNNYSYKTLNPVENKNINDIKIVIIILLMAFLSVIALIRDEKVVFRGR